MYRFLLTLQLGPGRETLPPYLGSTLRDVFASSFRRVVCVTRAPECHGCLLLHRCAYLYIFETPPPPDSPEVIQKRFRQAPRPYVLQVPHAYDGNSQLELGLIFVGKSIDFLPYFIYVLQDMGQYGLGRARVPYRLHQVLDGSTANGAIVFDATRNSLTSNFQPITFESMRTGGANEATSVTLEFLTPLRIKKYGSYEQEKEDIAFAPMMDLLLGRIESPSLFSLWRHLGT